jgi:molybdate transport repressor ModE-like protein
MSAIIEAINQNLNERGRLDCSSAFKIAAKLGVDIREVGDAAHEMDVRIDACELGQFGALDKNAYDERASERLRNCADEQGRVRCKAARECAAGIGLAAVRGTIARQKMQVIYCELGCFSEKKRPRMHVRSKIWIENSDGELVFGQGKMQILEAIKAHRSIVAAAEHVGMNYKKAWSHVQILQKFLDETLVITHKGGGEQGGSFLTEAGEEYIERYRQLQEEIDEFANQKFRELFLKKKERKS